MSYLLSALALYIALFVTGATNTLLPPYRVLRVHGVSRRRAARVVLLPSVWTPHAVGKECVAYALMPLFGVIWLCTEARGAEDTLRFRSEQYGAMAGDLEEHGFRREAKILGAESRNLLSEAQS